MSKAKQKTIEVEIYDQKYSIILKSAMEESELRRVADELDIRMREISAASNTADSLKVAVLTALHLAQENNEFIQKSDDWTRTLDQLFKR